MSGASPAGKAEEHAANSVIIDLKRKNDEQVAVINSELEGEIELQQFVIAKIADYKNAIEKAGSGSLAETLRQKKRKKENVLSLIHI